MAALEKKTGTGSSPDPPQLVTTASVQPLEVHPEHSFGKLILKLPFLESYPKLSNFPFVESTPTDVEGNRGG